MFKTLYDCMRPGFLRNWGAAKSGSVVPPALADGPRPIRNETASPAQPA
jgi:hypothetical protein